jgi:siroheme synthase-like protein
MFFPVYLNLKGKRVVVIGGGEVAERKTVSVLDAEASVTVVSPKVTSGLASLAEMHSIELHKRAYRPGDCDGAFLVLSATDDPEISKAVWEEANRSGVLINTADQPEFCDFIMPAVVRRSDLTIAISTGGTSPALAARLRARISSMLGPEYERLVGLLAGVRPEIRRRVRDEGDRKALHYRVLDSDVLSLLERNDNDGAERRIKEIIEEFTCQGKTS